MLSEKAKRNFIILFALILSIFLFFVVNNSIILSQIYYREGYDFNLPNSNEIIEKAETFDYLKYLNMYDTSGKPYNLSEFNANYIDKEYLDYLKGKIIKNRARFHWWLGYHYKIVYKFAATMVSKLYITYNNITIFNTTNENQETLFDIGISEVYIPDALPRWVNSIGYFYINFTQIPYVNNLSLTLVLNNIILVKMTLDYDHLYGNLGGEFFQIKQFVMFNSNIQVIFIYSPHTSIVMA